jgi:hypothetical protein
MQSDAAGPELCCMPYKYDGLAIMAMVSSFRFGRDVRRLSQLFSFVHGASGPARI